MNGGTFLTMLNALMQRYPELAFADVFFEDPIDGRLWPVDKIKDDRTAALAMIVLKAKEGK